MEAKLLESSEVEGIFSKTYFIRKNKTFKRKKEFPPSKWTNVRNIVSYLPGPKGNAKQVATPIATFECLITPEMLMLKTEKIKCIHWRNKNNFTRILDAENDTATEIEEFIDILIMSGMLRASHLVF